MTELRSAEEWVADLRKRKRPPGNVNLVGWVTEGEIAEVQRNALEAAAKAVLLCLAGEGVLQSSEPIAHRKPGHGSCCTCQTCGFRYDDCVCDTNRVLGALEAEFATLIPKDPAPAGQTKKGGDA